MHQTWIANYGTAGLVLAMDACSFWFRVRTRRARMEILRLRADRELTGE